MSSALGVPAFRRLWTAGLVSDTGDWLLFVALPLVVYRLSGSALGTSIAFLLELVPAVLLAPLAAHLADRVDRAKLMVWVAVIQAIALIPLLFVHGASELWIVYTVICAQAALSTLFEPAKNALLPSLVNEDRLVSANALVGLNQNLGRLIGGPIGGVLLAFGDLGLIAVVDALSYLVSAALIVSLLRKTTRPTPVGEDVTSRGGLLAALRRRELLGAHVVTFTASIAQGLFVVLFVLFVVGRLHGDDGAVGLLRGIQAIGAIGAGVGLGFLAKKLTPRDLVIASTAIFGLLSLLSWNLPFVTEDLIYYVVLFGLVGAPGVIMMTGITSALQLASHEADRGSVFAAFGLVSAIGQGVGILLAGVVSADTLLPLLEVQGCLYLLTAVLGAWLMPRRAKERVGSSPRGRISSPNR